MRKLLLFLIVFSHTVYGQSPLAIVRGKVTDANSGVPLVSASIKITPGDQTATTNAEGLFKFDGLVIGRYSVTVSYVGYQTAAMNEVLISTGKETVLDFQLLSLPYKLKDATVESSSITTPDKINERNITIEQTQRFASVVDDVARMAAYFPGVISPDDGNNYLSVHGNSPASFTWKLEGLDIINPNHLSNGGTFYDQSSPSGGGILMFGTNMIDRASYTANPLEPGYANTVSGVMDLHMRNGNNQKQEFTAQVGLIGLDIGAEGFIKKDAPASYLVNYRYSTIGLLTSMGVDFGDEKINFQDFNMHLSFPLKHNSELSLFAVAAYNENIFDVKTDTLEWEIAKDSRTINYDSKTVIAGFSYMRPLGSKVLWNSSAAYQYGDYNRIESQYNSSLYNTVDLVNNSVDQRLSFQSNVSYSPSNTNTFRIGLNANFIQNQFDNYLKNPNIGTWQKIPIVFGDVDGWQGRAYLNWKWNITKKFSIEPAVNLSFFSYSKSVSFDPKFTALYSLTQKSELALNYSRSTEQAPNVIYAPVNLQGSLTRRNENLDPYNSDYFSLVYSLSIKNNSTFRIEPYYQSLTNVPVNKNLENSYSLLNDWEQPTLDALANKGTGTNYGVDISWNKLLTTHLYYMASATLFNAVYTGSDSKEYDGRYNNGYAFNASAGYEFGSEKKSIKKIWNINLHGLYTGGARQMPINMTASESAGVTIFDYSSGYSEQLNDYWRLDLRITMRKNKAKWSQLWSLDIQNLLNIRNDAFYYYDSFQKKLVLKQQLGIIPILSWKAFF